MLEKKILLHTPNDLKNSLLKIKNDLEVNEISTWAIIPAAGKGLRFGGKIPKQYQMLDGEIILKRAINCVAELPTEANLQAIIVVLAENDFFFDELKFSGKVYNSDNCEINVLACKIGKYTRRDTVLSALNVISEVANENDLALVHDAVRPGLKRVTLERLWNTVKFSEDGAILALKASDTIKLARDRNDSFSQTVVDKTISRERCWLAQTPQIFPIYKLLPSLLNKDDATDECSAMEKNGYHPNIVIGDPWNLKITEQHDYKFLEELMTIKKNENIVDKFLIGQGYDVHGLVKDRKLVIGGVLIPYHLGLQGHSDADVLIHAILDGILGAAGMGDIGKLFPDDDSDFKDIDSRKLLVDVVSRIKEKKLIVNQIDSTVIAQKPKLTEFIDQMKSNIQKDTNCRLVNIKATTTEKLGFIGREEGIAAQAIVSLFSI